MAAQQSNFHPYLDLNPDQQRLLQKINTPAYDFVLGYGGGGSGKSLVIHFGIFIRALSAPGSRHGCFRLTRASCKESLFDKTLREVIQIACPGMPENYLRINESEMTVEFPNGSIINYDGLDENRLLKVRGLEYQTVWFNECNEFNYRHVSELQGRIRSPKRYDGSDQFMHNIFIADCNPRSKQDWEYKAFIHGINPIDGNALGDHDRWTAFKMDPMANVKVLGEDYVRRQMQNMTAADLKSLVHGEWSDDNPHAIFTTQMFADTRVPCDKKLTARQRLRLSELEGLTRVIVAVDPAVTDGKNSDLSGIVVLGLKGTKDDGHVYVLADYTMKGTPDAVCQKVVEAMDEWGATRVVIEKNQGGNWLEANMRKFHPNIDIKPVDASKKTGGKAARAEPVSAQYERKRVHHVGELKDLEEQMCEFGMQGVNKSPDRMDALVWGVWHLLDLANAHKPSYYSVVQQKGYFR